VCGQLAHARSHMHVRPACVSAAVYHVPKSLGC
jgi:hypothetical protein